MWISEISELEEARENNDERVYLLLHDDMDLFRLVDKMRSLYHNQALPTGLSHVILAGEEDHLGTFRAWDLLALKELMNAISKIPTVNYLGFQDIHRQNRVPVELISYFFQQMKHQVHTLEFSNIMLMGEQQQVQDFAQALQTIPGLRNYRSLDMNIFAPNNIQQSTASPLNLDSIFTTTCELPMLSCLEIECSNAFIPGSDDIWRKGVASTETLRCLLSSTQITSLHLSIGELDLDPGGLEGLVQAIGTNSNIADLGLYFLFNDATPRTQRNNKDIAMTKTPALFLAKALQINTTLREVSIKFYEDMCDAEHESFLVEMAKAIGNNPASSVRKLTIDSGAFPPGGKDALINLLKSSYTLESLEYDVIRNSPASGCTVLAGEKQTSIEFYLRLNEKGRKRVMGKAIEEVPRAQLVSTLASVSNDLDALYYYLRLNPCLCLEEANHSFRGRGKKRSRESSPQYTLSKDDEIERLKKELGDAQKQAVKAQEELGEARGEIKRLKRLLGNKNTEDA